MKNTNNRGYGESGTIVSSLVPNGDMTLTVTWRGDGGSEAVGVW